MRTLQWRIVTDHDAAKGRHLVLTVRSSEGKALVSVFEPLEDGDLSGARVRALAKLDHPSLRSVLTP